MRLALALPFVLLACLDTPDFEDSPQSQQQSPRSGMKLIQATSYTIETLDSDDEEEDDKGKGKDKEKPEKPAPAPKPAPKPEPNPAPAPAPAPEPEPITPAHPTSTVNVPAFWIDLQQVAPDATFEAAAKHCAAIGKRLPRAQECAVAGNYVTLGASEWVSEGTATGQGKPTAFRCASDP